VSTARQALPSPRRPEGTTDELGRSRCGHRASAVQKGRGERLDDAPRAGTAGQGTRVRGQGRPGDDVWVEGGYAYPAAAAPTAGTTAPAVGTTRRKGAPARTW